MALKTNLHVKRSQQNRETGPVLFVDVDGVISLFGFNPSDQPPGRFHSIDGILHCIGHDAAARIARLEDRYELVWATGWEEKANEYLVHILQMSSELPVLTFDGRARFGSAHWKLEAIDDYARWAARRLDRRQPRRGVQAVGEGADRAHPAGRDRQGGRDHRRAGRVAAALGGRGELGVEAGTCLLDHHTGGDGMADGDVDKAKGRLKGAAGELTGDQSLKNEGKVDKASGSVKNKVGGAADAVKDAISGKKD